jgi:hypothetical protein
VHLGRHEYGFYRRLEVYAQRSVKNTRFPGPESTDPLARPIQARSLREGKDSFRSRSGFATRFRDTLSAGVS